MENKKNWYVIFTKPKYEKKVSELLGRKGVVTFVPEQRHHHNWHGKERTITTAVFPSLLFVHAEEEAHLKIKKIEGVVDILFWLQKPAIVRDEEIVSLQQFLSRHSNVVVEKVKVITSVGRSFTDITYTKNKVVDISGEYEKLILPSIGFSLLAKIVIEEQIRITA